MWYCTTEVLCAAVEEAFTHVTPDYLCKHLPEHRAEFNCAMAKLALTSSAGCGLLVGIVRLRTKTTEFSLVYGNEGLHTNVLSS
jgi:hypothetical protein